MPADYFFKLEGIKGESIDAKHKDEIDVESFSWGLSRLDEKGESKDTTSVSDFSFVMPMSRAAPKLYESCAQGKRIATASFVGRKSGQDQFEFYKVSFEDVLISSVQSGGDGSALPMEQMTMSFKSALIQYVTQRADGSAGEVVEAFIKGE